MNERVSNERVITEKSRGRKGSNILQEKRKQPS